MQNLEPDFGALVTPGLQLAFDETVHVEIDVITLQGEQAKRTLPVCGPGAYIVLKALAFGDRGEPKDAYDLIYVIRGTPGAAEAIDAKLREHAAAQAEMMMPRAARGRRVMGAHWRSG